ncbi:MAG: hypothetical protein FWE34_02320 [Defluviitaleaceae bacterium]|nr:hypothetical protein [Defluviitaleaceae bacterium]
MIVASDWFYKTFTNMDSIFGMLGIIIVIVAFLVGGWVWLVWHISILTNKTEVAQK